MKIIISIITLIIFLFSNTLNGSVNQGNNVTNKNISDNPISVPSEYDLVIDDYGRIVKYRLSEIFESDYNSGNSIALNDNLQADLATESTDSDESMLSLQYKWHCMLTEMPSYIDDLSMDAFSYMLKDLNEDGVPELIWMSSDYRTVFSIFTIQENRAKLVDAYWPRYKAVILDSGEVVVKSSGGADIVKYTVYEIDSNADDAYHLVHIFGADRGEYYEIVNGEIMTISEEQYNKLLLMYPYEFGEKWEENLSITLGNKTG